MLFTDGIILTPHELREHDNHILEVASTESIELSSKLAISQRSIGYELTSFLVNRDLPIDLGRVIVNDEVRDLLAVRTLAAVYSDAYNRHLNDRYLSRWKEFQEASERGLRRLLDNGVGVTATPVQRAAKPLIADADSGALEPGDYEIEIAWQHFGGKIGEKSVSVVAGASSGGLVIRPNDRPINMAGWHIFIGFSGGSKFRQNDTPISVDGSWSQTTALRNDLSDMTVSGPDYYVRAADQRVRR